MRLFPSSFALATAYFVLLQAPKGKVVSLEMEEAMHDVWPPEKRYPTGNGQIGAESDGNLPVAAKEDDH